ncbi:MAG: tRNA uridine-5-carboxymethylaminomethyl(34) synthesis GTPase MnmE [Clostridiales bacterium]|nr:tRNA uridine-5-carboxymethylaminomethyl(34) synthesis GTPase MnmE [Clostridiales bacterium]
MRISGENARPLLERLFTGRIAHRRVSYGRIVDENGEIIDACCAAFFEAPDSYTGEDMAEISVHGSLAVARRLAEAIESTGLAEKAGPGDFTRRAYLNGKMDLAEAEAVMDMVAASAERSRRAAAMQLEGRLSAVIASLYERIKLACARLANAMDDDTGEAELDEAALAAEFTAAANEAEELKEGGLRSRILREGARVAIIGSPNVGKSSLLNALIMRERAIVTAIPGTTRDTVEEQAEIEGLPVIFVDTAGIRETDDEVEKLGIERARREADYADLVLWLVDGTRAIRKEDIDVLSGVRGKKTAAVITKTDLDRAVYPDADGLINGLPAFPTSAVTGEGLTALRRGMAELLLPENPHSESAFPESIVTNSRHIEALGRAADALFAAARLIVSGETDAAYFEARSAMDAAAQILGTEDPGEELVDAVFSHFCMGK